jgi:hypothetical protein
MNNEEIYQKLRKLYNKENMFPVCSVISTLYEIKFNAAKTMEASDEFDYERQWWSNKYIKSTTI